MLCPCCFIACVTLDHINRFGMFFLDIKDVISKTSKPVSFGFSYDMLMWIVRVKDIRKERATAGHLKCFFYKPGYHKGIVQRCYTLTHHRASWTNWKSRVAGSSLYCRRQFLTQGDRFVIGYPWLFDIFLSYDKLFSLFQNERHSKDI